MEAADDRGDGLDAGEPSRIADDIDNPGVPAPGQHDQTMTGDVDDEGLIIEDQRVGRPGPVSQRLVERHAMLEVAGAIHLAGDQYRIVKQQRWLAAFDDFKAGLSSALRLGEGSSSSNSPGIAMRRLVNAPGCTTSGRLDDQPRGRIRPGRSRGQNARG